MDEGEKPVYRDLWKEYRMVMEKTKKPPKLFNKFKWEDILAHLRLISHDMMYVYPRLWKSHRSFLVFAFSVTSNSRNRWRKFIVRWPKFMQN